MAINVIIIIIQHACSVHVFMHAAGLYDIIPSDVNECGYYTVCSVVY